MSTIMLTHQYTLPAQDVTEYMRRVPSFPGQCNEGTLNAALTKLDVTNNQVMGIIEQMDDNRYLVEYLNYNKELLHIRSFVNRGGLQCLAESIIGNGLVIGSRYIVVLRNRKSGIATPKLHDRQLIRYLLSGFHDLETTLLDYIINREGNIFSAKEAGMLYHKV
jgi:hypothetical protein